MKHFLAALLFAFSFLLSSPDSIAHSGVEHANDFGRVFEGFGGKSVDKLFQLVNEAIDSGFEKRIREKIPGLKVSIPKTFSVSGIPYSEGVRYNHRIFGHGWTFDAAIPEKVLKVLDESHPGCKAEVIREWRNFVNELTEKAVRLTGLPKNQAKALVAILWDIHLLGDWVPGNTRVDLMLPPGEILKNIEKNLRTLFKNRPQYAECCIRALKSAKDFIKGTSLQNAAKLINDALFELPLGEMLKDAWGKFLNLEYKSSGGVAKNTSKIPQRTHLPTNISMRSKVTKLSTSSLGKPPSGKPEIKSKSQGARSKIDSKTGKVSSLASKVQWAGRVLLYALSGATIAMSYGDYLFGNGTLKQANRDALAAGVGVAVAEGTGWLLGCTQVGTVISSTGVGAVVFIVAITASGAVYYGYHLHDEAEAEERILQLFEEHKKISTIEKLIRYENPQYN